MGANPNSSGALGVQQFLRKSGIETPVINIPGCPANPEWLEAVLVDAVLIGQLPELNGDLFTLSVLRKRRLTTACIQWVAAVLRPRLIAVSFAGTTVVLGVLLRAVLALVAAPLIQTILVRTGLKPTRHSVLVSVTCALVA